jgi:hypothetical protein
MTGQKVESSEDNHQKTTTRTTGEDAIEHPISDDGINKASHERKVFQDIAARR